MLVACFIPKIRSFFLLKTRKLVQPLQYFLMFFPSFCLISLFLFTPSKDKNGKNLQKMQKKLTSKQGVPHQFVGQNIQHKDRAPKEIKFSNTLFQKSKLKINFLKPCFKQMLGPFSQKG